MINTGMSTETCLYFQNMRERERYRWLQSQAALWMSGAEGIGQQHSLEDAHWAPLASLALLPILLPVSIATGAVSSVGCCAPGWQGTSLLINCAALGGGNLTTDSSGLALSTTAILAATVCWRAEDSHA